MLTLRTAKKNWNSATLTNVHESNKAGDLVHHKQLSPNARHRRRHLCGFTNLCFAAALLFASILRAETVSQWHLRTPLPSSANVLNAAYGNGVYVIVGSGGALITSSDLQNWHIVHRPELLENVIFDGTKFIISGYKGDILVSMDGTNWTGQASGTTLSLSGLDYGNGRYVAAGENGIAATSTNGTNWVTSQTGDTNWFFGVAYGEGLFVAVSFDVIHGNANGTIARTADGVNWTLASLPAGLPSYFEFYDVGYGAGRFTAAGYYYDEVPDVWGVFILTSEDGVTWSRVTHPNIPNSNFSPQTWLDVVRHDGTRWVGAGDNGLIMTSSDGLNWSVVPTMGGWNHDLYGLAFGSAGTTVVGARGKVFSSPDLTTWVENSSGGYSALREIAFNGSQYLGSSSGGQIFTSEDGRNWTQRLPTKVSGNLRNAVYGNGHWVVGNDSIVPGDRPLTVSANGITWDWPATVPTGFEDCRGLAFGNEVFVALPVGGTNSLILSTNAQDWVGTSHPWFTAHQASTYIEFGGGKFLAYASPSPTVEVAISSDGVNWEIHDTGTTQFIYSAAYGNGRWVLVGRDGQVVTTTNFTEWTDQVISFGNNEPVWLEGVAYGAGTWVIVGRNQQIWSSSDGLVWEDAFTTRLSGGNWIFWEVVFDGTSFWTCGQQGEIYQSQAIGGGTTTPILSILRTANPMENLLRIDGNAGELWDLVISPSLAATSWTQLSTLTLTNEPYFYIDLIPDGTGTRFYRLQRLWND